MSIRKASVHLTVVMALALVSCAQASPLATPAIESPAEMQAEAPNNQSDPGKDPQNTTYLIEGQPVTLVNGVAETELTPGSASKQVTRYFGNEVELDLDSNGTMDAAFLLTQESGGSGTFFYVAAALNTADGYVGTNAILLGDRIAPQSTNIDLNNPAWFVVNYADRRASEPMSTLPSVGVSRTFKVENGTLMESGTPPTQTP